MFGRRRYIVGLVFGWLGIRLEPFTHSPQHTHKRLAGHRIYDRLSGLEIRYFDAPAVFHFLYINFELHFVLPDPSARAAYGLS